MVNLEITQVGKDGPEFVLINFTIFRSCDQGRSYYQYDRGLIRLKNPSTDQWQVVGVSCDDLLDQLLYDVKGDSAWTAADFWLAVNF